LSYAAISLVKGVANIL